MSIAEKVTAELFFAPAAGRKVYPTTDYTNYDNTIPTAISIVNRSPVYMDTLNQQPAGLTQNMQELAEIPQDAVNRILMKGEVVIADFDCYYPFKALLMWEIIFWCVVTGGLFLFVLAFRVLQRMCYRAKFCMPKTLQFVRGKMAVTNYGRMICWTEEGDQYKQTRPFWFDCLCCICKLMFRDTCAPPTTYGLEINTAIRTVDSIREISHFFSTASECICVCNDFRAGVKISFNKYDHGGKVFSSHVNTQDIRSFYSFFQSTTALSLDQFASSIESALFLTSEDVVYIVSKRGDMMHMHNHASAIEDNATLYARFMDCLPTQPEIVVENTDLSAANRFNISNEFVDVTIVSDDGSVTLPAQWFTFLHGEKIIATSGQVYQMTKLDWLLSILSCGIFYCWKIRRNKFLRSAIVLTNKRIFVLDIDQRAGGVPRTMNNFSVQVTSYFPQKILSGYMSSTNKKTIYVGISTEGGGIVFNLHDRAKSIAFAKALQLSTCRLTGSIVLEDDKANNTPFLSAEDLNMVPLFANEKIIDGIQGAFSFEPFCFTDRGVQKLLLNCCDPEATKTHTPLCSKDNCGKFVFPWMVYCGTCALRPFQLHQDMYVTENTFFLIQRTGNYGLFGFLDGFSSGSKPLMVGPCAKIDSISISWLPIKDVQGHNLIVKSQGAETILRRCCKNSICGKCLPLSYNELKLSVSSKFVTFAIRDAKKNHNFSKDEKLRSMVATLDVIEKTNYTTSMKR